MKRKNKTTCKTPGCSHEAIKLGVCGTCYSVVYRAVRAGKLTWKQAEQRGLIGPRKRKPSAMRRFINFMA